MQEIHLTLRLSHPDDVLVPVARVEKHEASMQLQDLRLRGEQGIAVLTDVELLRKLRV